MQRVNVALQELKSGRATTEVAFDNGYESLSGFGYTRQAEKEIEEYFSGHRRVFDLALDTPGSPFQQHVWAQLCSVPFAETDNYQSLAIGIGKPGAVRAVAAANGANRVAIVIPCHRIIGKDGSMTGYGGGIARKAWLIAHEEKHRFPGVSLTT